jgi:hypothetical protein
MDIQYGHGHAGCNGTCCMDMDTQDVMGHAA